MFVPEAWQRAETERDNRLQVVKYAAFFAVALGALAALVFAVINWNRGHCDRGALLAVGALTFIVGVVVALAAIGSQRIVMPVTSDVGTGARVKVWTSAAPPPAATASGLLAGDAAQTG